MKKEFIIASTAALLFVTPAFAVKNENAHDKSQANPGAVISEENKAKKEELVFPIDPVDPTVTPQVTISVTPAQDPVELITLPTAKNHKKLEKKVLGATNITPSPAMTECDPNADWKNHGAYVSCVAKTHPGGKVVSAAAKSDIGKKNKEEVTPTLTPSVSPTATPSVTITPTPPLTSPVEAASFGFKPWKYFKNAVARFIHNMPLLSVFSH